MLKPHIPETTELNRETKITTEDWTRENKRNVLPVLSIYASFTTTIYWRLCLNQLQKIKYSIIHLGVVFVHHLSLSQTCLRVGAVAACPDMQKRIIWSSDEAMTN